MYVSLFVLLLHSLKRGALFLSDYMYIYISLRHACFIACAVAVLIDERYFISVELHVHAHLYTCTYTLIPHT